MFIPTTIQEAESLYSISLNDTSPDIILVTGDAYIDSPFIGISVIGHVLMNAGYKVGIIPQPGLESGNDISLFGEPRLFWGVTAGGVDSMVANYTATKKKRRQDDFTAGGENTRRPDRAVIVYSNLIRRYFKNTRPIVIGGIEASLRRVAHYDYWNDEIRKSILFDAKADILVYGMGERAVLEIAAKLNKNSDWRHVRGICWTANEPGKNDLVLPSYEEVKKDKNKFTEMFREFYRNNDSHSARKLSQKQDSRYLVQNPPAPPLNQKELDGIYGLEYERDVHPIHRNQGTVKALETIRFSIATHRGCFGECSFCAISMHQGRDILSRSEDSILNEVKTITRLRGFKGILSDIGGPTANMYAMECRTMAGKEKCKNKHCIGGAADSAVCKNLLISHEPQTLLLEKIRKIPGVKKVFVASGIRYDLILQDKKHGENYLKELVAHHVSGQLKVAPEHSSDKVLSLMNKPGVASLKDFKARFDELNRKTGKRQFLTYYFIAAHPGCALDDMKELKLFISRELQLHPEQVQIFMPTPSTYSTLMYYTEMDPFSFPEEKIFVEKDLQAKQRQKDEVVGK